VNFERNLREQGIQTKGNGLKATSTLGSGEAGRWREISDDLGVCYDVFAPTEAKRVR